MPTTPQLPEGAPVWIELCTTDVDVAVPFYTALFGWEHEGSEPEAGGYGTFTKGGRRIAGSTPVQSPDQAAAWSVYLQTSDAGAAAARATSAGATVVVEPTDVADLGRYAWLTDPGGAQVGLWQPGTHHGSELVVEHGAPAWYELMATDYPAALDFYASAALWDVHTMSNTAEFRYSTLGEGESARAGIMDASGFLPDGVPSFWVVYLGADDPDAAAKRVEELGGQVVEPPADTPFGRLATVADPLGTQFKIIGV
ncbi:VOC family protein [Antribacter gilvus]|uniref:VOC family protein n=1 Tax=Antribacter gilvus TaxID=2304675 RepID=UPI000F77E47C|nr:VOC family protein [Antribacter gilvus]